MCAESSEVLCEEVDNVYQILDGKANTDKNLG